MEKKKIKIKKNSKNKKREDNKEILIALVVFAFLSFAIFFVVKLTDWEYIKKERVAEISKNSVEGVVNIFELKKERMDFFGFVSGINAGGKSFSIKIFEPKDLENEEISFLIGDKTKINYKESDDEVFLEEISIGNFISVSAIGRKKNWTAEKIEINPSFVFLGKIGKILRNKIWVLLKSSEENLEEVKEILLGKETEIVFRNDKEGFLDNNSEGSLLAERIGELEDLEEEMDILVYLENNFSDEKGLIEALKVEIIQKGE